MAAGKNPLVGAGPALASPSKAPTRRIPIAAGPAVPEDATLLAQQARLGGPDAEIPAFEGGLLATRQEAVKRGLLSQAAFDASIALSRAMTQLEPAAKANAKGDGLVQNNAAIAAQLLFNALKRETADQFQQTSLHSRGGAQGLENPYTEELRVTTYALWIATSTTGSSFERLPALIRAGDRAAFGDYWRLMAGLDRWIADQLRKRGKSAANEARGNAHQYTSELRFGLEQIAGKNAKRMPAVFHPAAKIVAEERAAGRAASESIPMNVYVWRENSGAFHIYDLTTPGLPHEQVVNAEPSAAAMNTFFEEVARYPEGSVRYALPDGNAGVATTTGKTKWYEWVGYAGLAVAAVGLALATAGASIPATVCFATGALAGGLAAGGHLVDTVQLGTATSATVVLDVAQAAASFASVGAMGLTLKAGSAAAALASSRWFVPLLSTAAVADVVQVVALTDVTFVELSRIQNGPGTAEDKKLAMTLLLTQLTVAGGLTMLSVRGARDAHAIVGKPLELVEQNGVNLLRVVDEGAATKRVSAPNAAQSTAQAETGPSLALPPRATAERMPSAADAAPPPGQDCNSDTAVAPRGGEPLYGPATGADHNSQSWLEILERMLNSEERTKFTKMRGNKTPDQLREIFGTDPEATRARIRTELHADARRAELHATSKARLQSFRAQIGERGLMADSEVQQIVEGTTASNFDRRVSMLRDRIMAKLLRAEFQRANPASIVHESVHIYEKLPDQIASEMIPNSPQKKRDGLVRRDGHLYKQRGEIDILIVAEQPTGRYKVVAREEIKTGKLDTNAGAHDQLTQQLTLIEGAISGKTTIRLEVDGRDIVPELELTSFREADKWARGPAGKKFDKSLDVSAPDLEAFFKTLLSEALAPGGPQ